MFYKSMLNVFGIKFQTDTLVKLAFIEITVLAIIFIVLILLRYLTNVISHELFLELMIIIGVGMSFDHYSVTTIGLKK